jgi:glycolate oxidase iron-sulfur subunit
LSKANDITPATPGSREIRASVHSILAAADRCVMCGLCLPHCPTYRLLRNEADSPRGRIALMQALAAGRLQPSKPLLTHLERCLACRACERMCPSGVEYGKLIDSTREELRHRGQLEHPARLRMLLQNVTDIPRLQRIAGAMRAYQRSGLQWLTRKSGVLKGLDLESLETLLPAIPEPKHLHQHYPAVGKRRGAVGLFIGCIGSIMEGEIHAATIGLLTRLGFEVHVPSSQGCCGSLHQHNGDEETARHLAERNREVFAGLELDAIVSTASGCAAQLYEYGTLYGGEDELPAPLYEVCDFLQQRWPVDGLPLQSLPMRVALHLPCSQRNVLRTPDAAQRLLERIPGLELEPLEGNDECCGAAGSYMLTQPENADALRRRKVEAVKRQQPRLLLSNNIGCALHLAGGLKAQGVDVEVMHPVVLLAQSL